MNEIAYLLVALQRLLSVNDRLTTPSAYLILKINRLIGHLRYLVSLISHRFLINILYSSTLLLKIKISLVLWKRNRDFMGNISKSNLFAFTCTI